MVHKVFPVLVPAFPLQTSQITFNLTPNLILDFCSFRKVFSINPERLLSLPFQLILNTLFCNFPICMPVIKT